MAAESANGFAPAPQETDAPQEAAQQQQQQLTAAQRIGLTAVPKQLAATAQTNGTAEHALDIDVKSDALFPALGGAPTKAAPPVKWGVGTRPIVIHAAPASAGNPSQQTTFTLKKEDKKPPSDRTKAEPLRTIAQRTNTKIDAAHNRERGSTSYIIYGLPDDRERARRELMRATAVKVARKVSVPAAVRPFIIGRGGAQIQELQAKTLTNIRVPPADSVDNQAGEYEDEAVIDVIIEGDAEGCELAASLINKIVKERVIKITRTIQAPGKFYPFIQSHLQEYEGLVDRVVVPDFFTTSLPPPNFSEPSGPIEVIGERPAVEEVVGQIKAKILALKDSEYPVRSMDIGPSQRVLFARHDYRIARELLAETGCTLIVPPEGITKVYIVGPSSRIPEATNAISQRLADNKMIHLDICKPFPNAPSGPKAHAINVVRQVRSKSALEAIGEECDVDFIFPSPELFYHPNGSCLVSIVGKSKEYVDVAAERAKEVFSQYTPSRFAEVQVEPLHFKHIRGKDGQGAKRIAASTSVELLFSEDAEDDRIVLVYEGQSRDAAEISQALQMAKNEINELVKDQVEIVRKILEVPQELHEKIRGEQGTVINALNPSSAFVQFGAPKAGLGRIAPKANHKAENTITLRGPPAHVAAAAANIQQFLKDNPGTENPDPVTESFDYPKQFSGNLIGAKGANINRLRDDFGVDIKLSEGSGEIKGVKVCVNAARRKLNAQVKELEDKAVISIRIPQQFHSTIIGSEGSTVRRLEERYHVRINFPRAAAKVDEDGPRQAPDEIIIRGSKKGAEEARQEICDLWHYEAENAHTAVITILAKSLRYFKNASRDIKQLRDEFPARISVPSENPDVDPESTLEIKIRGKKDHVAHAKTILSRIVKDAENTTTRVIAVDKKYHRSLIGPGGQTLRDIVVKAGGPADRQAQARLVHFPGQESGSNEITVQGRFEVVDKIVELIEGVVAVKASQVTEEVAIAPEKHRKLIGRGGSTRRELESQFDVTIGIPRQRADQSQTDPNIKITGVRSAVGEAKAHILGMIKEPEGETLEVPRRLYHAIADGGFFKHLQKEYKVTVDHNGLPKPARPEDPKPTAVRGLPLITDETADGEERVFWEVVENPTVGGGGDEGSYPWILHGPTEGIARAKAEIESAVGAAVKQSHTGFLILPDPSKYRLVVGHGGSTVDRIRKETGCRIVVPRNQPSGGCEAITLRGEKEGLEKAKDAILRVVKSSNGHGRN